jgi:hypothetical protein
MAAAIGRGPAARALLIDRIVGSDTFDLANPKEFDYRVSLSRDMHHLRGLAGSRGVDLFVIDPVVTHCEQAESEPYLRALLSEMTRLAFDCHAAVLGIAHLRHDPEKTDIYRALGSRAMASVPRTIWTVQLDRSDRERRLVLPLKMNLGPVPAGLAFRFGADRLVWENDPIHRMASDPHATRNDESAVLEEARDFVRTTLADGEMPATDLLAGARALGLSHRTLYRAKRELEVRSIRKGFGASAVYYWSTARGHATSRHEPKPEDAEGDFPDSLAIYGRAMAQPVDPN